MSPSNTPPVLLRIVSDPAYLCVVRAAAERFCLLIGFDARSAQAVGLALDEALANVISHGYSGRRNQPIHIGFHVRQPPAALPGAAGDRPAAGELCIRVRDFGRQVSASEIHPRPLAEIRPGGLGVHIIRSVMDKVEYRPRGLAGMELLMVKARPAGEGGASSLPEQRCHQEPGP